MNLGKIMLAHNKAYMAICLLGFVLLGYLTWHAHQHMQKSMATKVLSVKNQKIIQAPATPKLALTDAFLASAQVNERTAPKQQEAVSDYSSVLKSNTGDQVSLENASAIVDKPKVESQQDLPMADKTRIKQFRKHTLKKAASKKSLHLTVNNSPDLLHPKLMQAYQAYYDGDDDSAQAHYKQVLDDDSANVDAMLGMAAIVQRQGRQMDAAGWYQSVLALAPKNTVALVSNLLLQDKATAESRIKTLLLDDPDAAYLHAALAHGYAEQGLWAEAEAAYFRASQLAPDHAEYAYNLAVSLDQMGKAQLALQQYARVLVLLKQSASDSLTKDAVMLRMTQLE